MAELQYVPWMAKAGEQIGNAMLSRQSQNLKQQQNKLIGSAYMGDPQAMQELMQVNPEAGLQVQQELGRKKDAEAQKQLQERTGQQKSESDMQSELKRVLTLGAKLPYEQAKPYVEGEVARLSELYPELQQVIAGGDGVYDQEEHTQYQAQFGEKPKDATGFQGLVKAYQEAPEGSEEKKLLESKIRKETAQSGGITVNPDGTVVIGGPLSETPKAAKTALFKDIVENQQSLDSIAQIETLYEPEFLTYKGAAKGQWATFLNKLDPEDRSNFQQRRSSFISAANQNFLAFRKWATGVSGGEKEMAEIKRATFSEDDSPQDFESKLGLIKSLKRRLNARAKSALAVGIDNENQFKEYIKDHSLADIPTIQARGEALQRLGYDKAKVKSILAQEGYM